MGCFRIVATLLVAAAVAWVTPVRAANEPVKIEMIQNIYIRKVERLPDGQLYNVEFATVPNFRDPSKPKK